jgi:hypothetical protein
VIAVSPYNKPFSVKSDWIYELPDEVKLIYRQNGFGDIMPNYTAYMWLTNQSKDMRIDELELIVDMSKYWSYLFLLLRNFFPESEIKLYQQIQELLVVSYIRTSLFI